jgi:hypothetical protein
MLVFVLVFGCYGFTQAGLLNRIPSAAEYATVVERLIKAREELEREMPEHEREQIVQQRTAEIQKLALLEARFAGEALRDALNQEQDVVAKVNGEPVFLSDIIRHKAELDLQSLKAIPFKVTEELVMERAVLEKAMYIEAKNRDLLPSPEELAEIIEDQKRIIYGSQDPKQALDAEFDVQQWTTYLNALGVSDDQYWESIAPEFYEASLIRYNLAKNLGNIEEDEWLETWEQFQKQLTDSVELQILRNDLIVQALRPVSSNTWKALVEQNQRTNRIFEPFGGVK